MTVAEPPLRILLVEDDPAHAELIRRAFEARGESPEIRVVRSVAEANESLAGPAPDLLITDWRLPDGDGVELLRQHQRRTFPAIVMTGHGDQRTAVRAMRAGALDYVIKSGAAFERFCRNVDLQGGRSADLESDVAQQPVRSLDDS